MIQAGSCSKLDKDVMNNSQAPNQAAYEQLPNKNKVIEILRNIEELILPEFCTTKNSDLNIQEKIELTQKMLIVEMLKAFTAANKTMDHSADSSRAELITNSFFSKLINIREVILKDAHAGYRGDPAAIDWKEVVLTYPGFKAILIYRIAHELYLEKIPYIPRIMSEHAHSITGVDIHPGANIGMDFFIDHGTGVVIGETTEIGNRVKIYQGVTLGALSFPTDEKGETAMRGKKRHPTIEDDVTIYAGATILGGNTVVGKSSIIGGNVWLTESVPENSKVLMPRIDLRIKNGSNENNNNKNQQ